MLTVVTLLKVHPSPNGEQHGERPFWRDRGQQYLEAWVANVRRYVPRPRRIVVMTDSPDTVYDCSPGSKQVADVDPIELDETVNAPGWWSKLNAFRPEVSSGKTLYLDLDNVITAPLDALCALEPDPLIMLDDRHVPRLPNGSMMLFDAERCRGIWEQYTKRPRQYERDFRAVGNDYSHAYDQAFIAEYLDETGHTVPLFQDLLPDGYCLNAYSELPHAEDWRTAHLIFGCGAAKPHSTKHQVFAEHWDA